jgi:hypothetical protein
MVPAVVASAAKLHATGRGLRAEHPERETTMRILRCSFGAAVASLAAIAFAGSGKPAALAAASPGCGMAGYRPSPGLTASAEDGGVSLGWVDDR